MVRREQQIDMDTTTQTTAVPYATTLLGKHSPWGKIDHATTLADGIATVSTPSHGGVKLDRKRNAKMPAAVRRKGGWYEEDCEWALVVLVFPEAFKPESVEAAHSSAKGWFPDEYTAITGKPVAVEESYTLQKRAFKAETANRYVVVSACGDWHEKVPKSMVGVSATLGGDRGHKAWEAQIHRLVPEDAYAKRGRFGYVLDGTEPKWEKT